MPFIPYDSIVAKIQKETNLSSEEIDSLIEEKLKEFSGLISKEGAAHIIANENGVSLTDIADEPFRVKDLKNGMRQISIIVKIVRKYNPVTFDRNGKSGVVASAQVADETGTTRLTFWHDDVVKHEQMEEGIVYLCKQCIVRENQGRLELHATGKTVLEPHNKEITVSNNYQQNTATSQGPLKEVTIDKVEVGDNQKITGTIVQVVKPVYYVVDKNTGKKVKVDAIDETLHQKRYLCNAIIDDGTDSIRCVFFGDLCAHFLQTKMDQLVLLETEEVFEKTRVSLLGATVSVSGRIVKNEVSNRLECIARTVEFKEE